MVFPLVLDLFQATDLIHTLMEHLGDVKPTDSERRREGREGAAQGHPLPSNPLAITNFSKADTKPLGDARGGTGRHAEGLKKTANALLQTVPSVYLLQLSLTN